MPRIKKEEPSAGQAALLEPEAETKPDEREKGQILTLADYKKLSLWQALEQMTEEDWADKMLYISRISPFTINKTTGEKYGSLDKGKFYRWTEDQFKDRFGGGRFHIWLKRGRDTCCEATPQWDGDIKLLVDEELKTRVQQSGIAQAPGNGEETAKVVKMFLEEQRRQREEGGDTEGAEVLESAIELMSRASEKAIEIAAGARGNGGLGELTTAMKSLHEMIAPKESITSKDLLDFGVKMAREMRVNPSEIQPQNQIEQFRSFMKLMKELKDESPAAPSGPREDWKVQLVAGIGSLVQNLPAILREQRQAQFEQFQMMIAMRGMSGPPMMTAAGGMPPAMGQAAAPPPAVASAAIADELTRLKQNVVKMFKDGDDGRVVARLIQVLNPVLYTALSKAPEEEIKKFIAADPILKEISDSEDLPQFIKELLMYFEEEAASPQQEEAATTVQ